MTSSPLTFNTRRQLELFQAGGRFAPDDLPVSNEDLEARARERLPVDRYDFIAGGAGSDDTVRANLAAFQRWRLVPRMLCDVTTRDLSVELFGRTYASPVLLAPIGVHDIVHPEGEVATGRGAAAVRVPLVASTVASRTLEEIAEAMGDMPRWFQLYWSKHEELTASLLARAERAGYSAIVITLDTPTLGWRERNLQTGFMPFLNGGGMANYLSDAAFRNSLPTSLRDDLPTAIASYLSNFSNLGRTWGDLQKLRAITKLPLLVKGILHPDDARRALDCGMDGIVVSNHGGRQVDGAIASLAALPAVVKVVDGRVPVLLDGGVRRGADILKAIALGAKAVLVGRPYIYALAIGGANGVRDYLTNLLADLDVTLALCGKRRWAELDVTDVTRD